VERKYEFNIAIVSVQPLVTNTNQEFPNGGRAQLIMNI